MTIFGNTPTRISSNVMKDVLMKIINMIGIGLINLTLHLIFQYLPEMFISIATIINGTIKGQLNRIQQIGVQFFKINLEAIFCNRVFDMKIQILISNKFKLIRHRLISKIY